MKTLFTSNAPKLSIQLMKPTLVMALILCFFSTSFMNLDAQNTASKSANNVQESLLKGIVADENGPLLGVNILLKGTTTGTFTDEKGAFTFPKALKQGDVLVFSFVGYDTKEIKLVGNLTMLKVEMTSDLNEILGTVDTNTPYKSKRSKRRN
ncbi:carboxypeptidase-like regulatory domain-containing protein [Psychroserpens sp.]|uniref:carboxypeptidase-like regulatory domain-containing protein n=1 Tax=Psychroserpens sp. TaxID=2020870 RepID=UPI002AA79B55|nr:carboxypeptidase-like regulatory domain-containing protein [Psychroserpens sp.]